MVIYLIGIGFNASAYSQTMSLPVKAQRIAIADELLQGIEHLDAISIGLRNRTREVDWPAFKAITRAKISAATNWREFNLALNNVHFGIINRHSFVLLDETVQAQSPAAKRWPVLNLAYTWPNVSFYHQPSGKPITKLNGQPIEQLFQQFFNLYCNQVHQSGCLNLFSRYLKQGYSFLGYSKALTLTYNDNTTALIEHSNNKAKATRPGKNCAELYPRLALKLLFSGEQSCLFSHNDSYIIKLKYFGNWGAKHHDTYCGLPDTKGMCSDINNIRQHINNKPKTHLVIDLQNNPGGSENTPWLAALTHNGFKDNLVQYRNLNLLSQPKIRQHAFYFSDKAENWYQSIIAQVKDSDPFLPVRPDFCRSTEISEQGCDIGTIGSADKPIRYQHLHLVINDNCVSSCDDMVWRLRQYANASTFGQPPATDGAYARLHGYVLIDDEGNVSSVISGEGDKPELNNKTVLLRYQIPISKTVNQQGHDLEGDANVLDHPLAITKQNFSELELANLQRTLASL